VTPLDRTVEPALGPPPPFRPPASERARLSNGLGVVTLP
jgi:hypothetical protein